MSFEVELAKTELRIAEDVDTVTAAEVMRWLRSRPLLGTEAVIATVERAAMAVGMAKRLSP